MKLRTRRAIRKFYSDIVLPSIDATDSLGFVGFMSAGLVQALGGLLNMKWVVGGFITGGSLCQVQGHLKQIGDVSITLFRFYALSSLYIAFDTFLVLVFSWRASRAASIGGLISICLFIVLVVAPGSGINRGKRPACVGDIDYWCWITKEYNTYRIDLEYLWMWMATLVMLTLYGFIALVIHGSPIVEGQRVRFRGKDNKLTHRSSKDENMDDKKDNQEIMKLMLFYPAVYILCVLPVSVIRWTDFTSDDTVPTGGIIFANIVFQLSVFFNVFLFKFTWLVLFLCQNIDPSSTLDDSSGAAYKSPVLARRINYHHHHDQEKFARDDVHGSGLNNTNPITTMARRRAEMVTLPEDEADSSPVASNETLSTPSSSSSAGPESKTAHQPTGQPPGPSLSLSGDKAMRVETPISPIQTAEEASNPWETCLGYAKKYVDEEITVWRDEVDNLLIFAGLFSSVVASFAVEAYHNVKEDPADTTVLLLKELLVIQLNATNPQPGLAGIELNPRAPISFSAKRVVIYHFLSLFLSLSTAMIGILCLQWIREYSRSLNGIPGPRREQLGIHFMRYCGLEKWQVFTILTTLPTLLLLSLLLFFIGIVDLLIDVDDTAGAVAAVMAGLTFSFILATTLLPGLVPCTKLSQCPYKSPQAWIFSQFLKVLLQMLRILFRLLGAALWKTKMKGREHNGEDRNLEEGKKGQEKSRLQFWSWLDHDWHVYQSLRGAKAATIGHGLHWLGAMYLQSPTFADALYECISSDDGAISDDLRDVLEQQAEHRSIPVDEAFEWPSQNSRTHLSEREIEKKVQEHGRNVLVSHTLAHLANKIEQGEPSGILLNKRLELLLMIAKGLRPDVEVDFPLMSSAHLRLLVSRETRVTILRIILDQMRGNSFHINKTHISVMKGILMLELEHQEDNPDAELVDEALKVLDQWVKSKDGRKLESKARGDKSMTKSVNDLKTFTKLAAKLQ
ncbi:hypothetical protein AN958_08368 [Leucoagaricus sp. SymC.cos]|nr:hypothetical protein AN958_08368 [Leucoagaricus sp. SymC.cos]